MKKALYLTSIFIFSLCFVACEDDAATPAHECNSCGTEQCECSHSDTTATVCASCGMENCTMGCATN
ncbi:hypothetical protein N9358_01215 [Flavobacteriales bacterium]|nr:hypothetical protein [Flavobacteriales bacterium]